MNKENLYTLELTKDELEILEGFTKGLIVDIPVVEKHDRGVQLISSYAERVLNLHNKIVTAKKGKRY